MNPNIPMGLCKKSCSRSRPTLCLNERVLIGEVMVSLFAMALEGFADAGIKPRDQQISN